MKKYNCLHGIQSLNYKPSKDTKSSQGINDNLGKVLTNMATHRSLDSKHFSWIHHVLLKYHETV
jgi:hypothetical protein